MEEQIRAAFRQRTGLDAVRTAWIGGSATWGARCPEDFAPQVEVVPLDGFETPFGRSIPWKLLWSEGAPILRVRMHGWHRNNPDLDYSHTLQVFYVLRALGVEQAVVDASVGGVTAKPWDIVIPDDFLTLDQTTRFEARRYAAVVGMRRQVRLVEPFCPRLREALAVATRASADLLPAHSQLHEGGTYFNTPLGPFETAAEIRVFKEQGATVVGMTLAMEAMLARLNRMCLASLDVVANWAEGLEGGEWVQGGMYEFYEQCAVALGQIGLRAVTAVAKQQRHCHCDELAGQIDRLAKFPVE
ncbi:MAG: phosphorylase family protein [Chloroflexota bacterium]